MIEIKQVKTFEGLENFNLNIYSDGVIMAAYDNGEILGAGCAVIKKDYAILDKISVKEGYDFLYHAIAKSLLNLVDLSGIKNVYSSISDTSFLKSLKFSESADKKSGFNYYLNLEGYFSSNC